VEDFSKVLNYLQTVSSIPEKFAGIDIQSPLLQKLVRLISDGGCFPDVTDELDWFFENFDVKEAASGRFEPFRGVDEAYDEACDAIERIERELADYKDEMCNHELKPSHVARSKWKFINTKVDSKDKYLIELPASVQVPEDFHMKGKRGKGDKQVNKYSTPVVEQLVQELEHALDVQREGKSRGMQLIFAKFDEKRHLWAAAAQATALLDALGSLAQASSRPGFTRPKILECPPDGMPSIRVVQGRHPCVDTTHSGGDFIPNDLVLGEAAEMVLLLSGPNMGGKSTLLRQTCLLAILAQIGCFVPALECSLTPVDRIYTRLGASDRILQGHSTFFVELSETACALRGATRRSLVIMDELGRGTSTFDGCAIASAAVKHLVERNRCLTLFATHYHSVLDEWQNEPTVRLGHMECIVEGSDPTAANDGDEEMEDERDHNITFLYTLGTGACPKSFGINVARLAGLPESILANAKKASASFEAELSGIENNVSVSQRIIDSIESGNFEEAERIWESLQ
jgi:DNA mismatch repair protein MSH6